MMTNAGSNPKISVIVVDDELLGRRAITTRLAAASDVDVIAECGDGASAIDAIRNLQPDVVFLDVQMPELDGFDVMSSLGDSMPLTVMVTAYHEHAVRAFDHHAVDYVLKPVNDTRFAHALSRVRTRLRERTADTDGTDDGVRRLLAAFDAPVSGNNTNSNERLVIRATGSIVFVDPRELAWLEASGNYVHLHVRPNEDSSGEEEHVARMTISAFEKRLPANDFCRVHRSFIVNMHHVREIRLPRSGAGPACILRGDREVPIGRSYHDEVMTRLASLD